MPETRGAPSDRPRARVVHVITMLEWGGAQENTLYTVAHLDRERFSPFLLAGPGGILDGEARGLPSPRDLSGGELEVFEALGRGLSTREVAARLNLSIKTVETHRENIKHKLGLPDAAGLARRVADWVQSCNPPPAISDRGLPT